MQGDEEGRFSRYRLFHRLCGLLIVVLMSKLYIRGDVRYFDVKSSDDVDQVVDGVVGDYATWNDRTRNHMLKAVEDSGLDVYSSTDVIDPILCSRFTEIVKESYDSDDEYVLPIDRRFMKLWQETNTTT